MIRPTSAPTLVIAMALACVLLLVLPGSTVTTAFVNDLLIFLDGAHRIAWGQVPNKDFHTALGPLVFYIPALGYALSGSFGSAMPAGMGFLILALTPLFAAVLTSRLRPILALPLAALLLLLLAAPLNPGSGITSLSFAMFYNRIGWVLLAVLLLLYLPPSRSPWFGHDRQAVLDGLCATLLTLVMLYTKASYGAVALAFLVFLLFDPRHRRWAGAALVLVLLAVLVVEFFWQASLQHGQDLLDTARVSGGQSFAALVRAALWNLPQLTLFAIIAGLALWRTRSPRDLLFYGFCAATGVVIVNQNAQALDLVTLYAGAAVAAETLMRQAEGQPSPPGRPPARPVSRPGVAAAAPLLLLLLTLPAMVRHTAALLLHFGLALSSQGTPFGLPNFEGVRFAQLWSEGDHGFSALYVGSFARGAEALEDLESELERVVVLDFSNPFSAGLGLRPPRGDSAWLHWNRNVNAGQHLPPAQLLGDAKFVMVPEVGINSLPLQALYGPYLTQHFDLVQETELWSVHLRQGTEDSAGNRALPDDPDGQE